MAEVGKTYPIKELLKSADRSFLTAQNNSQVDLDKALDGKVVGIYFSAHWCPPCRRFTPILASVYKELKQAGKPFEVVFVSSDRDEDSFKEYFKEMPWLAVPFQDRDAKKRLGSLFGVSGIPTLLVFDAHGKLIQDDTDAVEEERAAGFPWAPKRVQMFQSAARFINKKTCLFAVLEALPKAQQDQAAKDLSTLGNDAKNDDVVLATAFDADVTTRLRQFLGLSKSLLLLFADGLKYVEQIDEYKEGGVQAFLAKYRGKSLAPLVKSAARPPHDSDASHPGITIVTANSFEELCLDKDKSMFLDVYADWCPPCRALAPTILAIGQVVSEMNIPNLRIGKFDCDANDSDPKYLPETTIPTLKFFHRGGSPILYSEARDGVSILTWLHKHTKGSSSEFDLAKAIERFNALKGSGAAASAHAGTRTGEDDD